MFPSKKACNEAGQRGQKKVLQVFYLNMWENDEKQRLRGGIASNVNQPWMGDSCVRCVPTLTSSTLDFSTESYQMSIVRRTDTEFERKQAAGSVSTLRLRLDGPDNTPG